MSLFNYLNMEQLTGFRLFDPSKNNKSDLPRENGNYIVAIRDVKKLPFHGYTVNTTKFQDYPVIYTGITSNGLYTRIGNQHLGTNAGRSTLRLSLGCLLGYKLVPRDKNNPDNGKVRFSEYDEMMLLNWMKENLLFYYQKNYSPESLETKLIDYFNPPLNLKGNNNPTNLSFRDYLSILRSKKKGLCT